MGLGIEKHTVRSLNLDNAVFAEIEFTALCNTVLAGRNGIDQFSGSITERSVGRDNIGNCTDFKNRTRKTAYLINRLIQRLAVLIAGDIHAPKDLAGLFHDNDAFLRHILFVHFNHSNPAFFGGIILRHIKINRSPVNHIAVRCLNLNERVSLAVGQHFGCDKFSVRIGIENIDCSRCRIGKGH